MAGKWLDGASYNLHLKFFSSDKIIFTVYFYVHKKYSIFKCLLETSTNSSCIKNTLVVAPT